MFFSNAQDSMAEDAADSADEEPDHDEDMPLEDGSAEVGDEGENPGSDEHPGIRPRNLEAVAGLNIICCEHELPKPSPCSYTH